MGCRGHGRRCPSAADGGATRSPPCSTRFASRRRLSGSTIVADSGAVNARSSPHRSGPEGADERNFGIAHDDGRVAQVQCFQRKVRAARLRNQQKWMVRRRSRRIRLDRPLTFASQAGNLGHGHPCGASPSSTGTGRGRGSSKTLDHPSERHPCHGRRETCERPFCPGCARRRAGP